MAVPIVQGEKELLIVACGTIARLDHQEAVLAAVLGASEVAHGHGVSVIPAKSGRTWCKRIACGPAGSDGWRALLQRAIYIGREKQTVPMDHFRTIAVIADLDGDRLALFEAQQGAGSLAVVRERLALVTRRQLESDGSDVQPVVRRRRLLRKGWKRSRDGSKTG
jgi:hypothetical protein